MAAYSVTSPLCTWLVAACMSVPNEKVKIQSRRRGRTKCNYSSSNSGLISAFCGSSFQGLISSFEPCEEYNSSKGFSDSLCLFGDNGGGFSLFGSKTIKLNRNQRRNQALNAGKPMAVALEPAKVTPKKPLTKQRRVVVTGTGVVTPLGHESDVFYNNLLDGVSGIGEIEAFDCAQFPTRIAGEDKSFSTDGWVAPKLSKRADKFMLYMLTAGKKALTDDGIIDDVMDELDKTKCGVLIGSAMGGMKVISETIDASVRDEE